MVRTALGDMTAQGSPSYRHRLSSALCSLLSADADKGFGSPFQGRSSSCIRLSSRYNGPMLIGLKLDIGFAQDEEYERLYGKRDVLAYLRDLGIEAVETPVGAETNEEELKEHIARCVAGGMKVSLHPYSEGTDSNPAFFAAGVGNPCRRMHERLLALAAETARLQGCPTLVNIHSASGTPADSRQALVERSVAFFAWAADWCRRNAPDVVVTVELQIRNTYRGVSVRIGDSYDELRAVAERSGVVACWDFGHAFQNATRQGDPLFPPPALVKRVGHVHCHDADGDDHRPLVYDAVPWRDFLRLLMDHGYDGRIILEVSPAGFLHAGGIDTLARSVAALRAFLAQRSGR
jgi:sugar phosphate isomerase/epimerase